MHRRVRVIGVDLAWGVRNRTGLCAVEDGRVLDSACLVSDADIEAWIRRWWSDEILVAIDAPLIVPNTTGRRPCEAVFASVFGPRWAGPHSANLTRLGGDVRGERLATRLGLSVAPDAFQRRPIRAAIEVFPHPALVVFMLREKRLPYKVKAGRALSVCPAAMVELLQWLVDLQRAELPLDVMASPEWRRLADACHAQPNRAALKRLEDEIDAYVCAYIGLYHLAWAGTRSLTVGDGARGYIVTPAAERDALHIGAAATDLGVPVS